MLPKIICTSSAAHIGRRLEKRKVKIIWPQKNRDGKNYFPDGETYAALTGIKKGEEKCIILHSGSPRPNDGLSELKMILEILNSLQVGSIEIFFSYFPYGMQDGIFDKGETNTAENLVKEFVNYYGVKRLYVVDAHFYKKSWTKKYPIINVSVFNKLAARARQDFPGIIFISPDTGAIKRNGITGTKKERINSFKIKITKKNSLKKIINGKTIGVVDDILETGGTLDKFYDECKALGAKEVVALITHGVLEKGIIRIQKKYKSLYITNTIKQKRCSVDVQGIITRYI